jgi:hypothetical protein
MNKNNKIIHKLVKEEIDLVIKNAEKRELCKKTKCAKLYKEKKKRIKFLKKSKILNALKTYQMINFMIVQKYFMIIILN